MKVTPDVKLRVNEVNEVFIFSKIERVEITIKNTYMMKKIVLLTVATFVCISLNAQNFGLRAGVDFASMKLEFMGESDTESETGFYVGFFGSFDISDTFAIRPEVNYIGVEDLDQIAIPVLAQYSASDAFRILAGPNFGFILDPDEGTKSFNFGLDFGLAYNFTEKFALEGRYNLGISNLIEDGDMFDASVKLRGFFFGLAYALN